MKARFLLPLAILAFSAVFTPSASAHLVDGQVWLIDYTNDKMYRLRPSDWALFTTFSDEDGLVGPGGLGFTRDGLMLLVNHDTNELMEWDGDTQSPSVIGGAGLGINGPYGANNICTGPGLGDIYIGNWDTSEILRMSADLSTTEVWVDAADGLVHPVAMKFLADGHMVVANEGSGGNILKVHTDGDVEVFDNIAPAEAISLAVRDNGDLYVLTDTGVILRYAGADPLARTVLTTMPAGVGGIEMDWDSSRLFHISQATAEFRTIDPDTGADQVVKVLTGKRPYGISVTGSGTSHGTFTELGGGLFGTGFQTPKLFSDDEPRLGSPATLHLRDFVGGTVAYLFLGLGLEETTIYGGNFHVDLSGEHFWTVKFFATGGSPGAAGTGDFDVPFVMPSDPIIIGTKWWMQTLAPDTGALFDVSFSNALQMYVGDVGD